MKSFFQFLIVCLLVLGTTGALFYVLSDNEHLSDYGFTLGEKLQVKRGFYTGCVGFIEDYRDWRSRDDEVKLINVTCPTIKFGYLDVEAKNVEKEK